MSNSTKTQIITFYMWWEYENALNQKSYFSAKLCDQQKKCFTVKLFYYERSAKLIAIISLYDA